MLDSSWMLSLARFVPHAFDGPGLHRAALYEAWRGRPADARRLFAAAAVRYRRGLEVERLARLRVHELLVEVRAGSAAGRDGARVLEAERRLARLDRIEALEPPFAPVPARRLLASAPEPRAA